jgi:hypothetical protein
VAVYTPNQHGPAQLAATYGDLIASDGSNTHIIRTITLVNTDTVSHTAFITIGAGAAATEVYETATILPNTTTILNGWWTVPTSTAVQGKADTANKVTVTLSGYHYA